jgi:molybdate transport system regulatory protein
VPEEVKYLEPHQVEALARAFRAWAESADRPGVRLSRRRVRLIFLVLRSTGAKLGEVLALDDTTDLDLDRGNICFGGGLDDDSAPRMVQLADDVVDELRRFFATPESAVLRGEVFRMDGGYIRKKFYERAADCDLPKEMVNPSILRHTRAIEMLRLGLPLPAVQYVLGHKYINLTAHYLNFTNDDIQSLVTYYLTKEAKMKTSARNTFSGQVTAIRKGTILSEVELTTPGNLKIVSVITNESLENLGIRQGLTIVATVKAPWVVLVKEEMKLLTSARNKFCGKITTINEGAIAAEVVVDLPDGTKIVSLVTDESVKLLDLKVGDTICALFKAFSVILNVV